MTEAEELTELLRLHRRTLLELANLMQRLDQCGWRQLDLRHFAGVVSSVRQGCEAAQRVVWVYGGLLPSFQQSVAELQADAAQLRRLLRDAEESPERWRLG